MGYIAPKLDWETLYLPTEGVRKERRCFTPSESQRLIRLAPSPWDLAFALGAWLGLRCGEILGLSWASIDLAGAVLQVQQSAWEGRIQAVKSRSSRRDLPMPAALVTMLADYKTRWEPNDQGLLFCRNGRPASAQYFRRVLHRVRKQLGIPSGACHAFRHGHATVMFSAGANAKVVQDAMGHATLAMTMEYTHAIAQDRRDAVERATQMFLSQEVPTGTA